MERASVREAPHRKVRISSNPAKQVASTKSISLAWRACLSTIEQSGRTHKCPVTLLVQDNTREGIVSRPSNSFNLETKTDFWWADEENGERRNTAQPSPIFLANITLSRRTTADATDRKGPL